MTTTVPAEPAVVADGLERRFGQVRAVAGIDLTIGSGEVFGLLGPDGAGKSTLIRMLATVLRPDAGDARVFGASVTRRRSLVTPRIGYMSQRFSMYPDLTVQENLNFFATLRGVPRERRISRSAALLQGMGLAEFAGRRARNLSGGMKQKLTLAATLMHEPELLLLDEPTTGVDPVSRREFWRILAGLHREGRTVLVATPYMDEAERCTRVAFMDSGRIRHHGSPAEIKSLVPGILVEVFCDRPRAALDVLRGLRGVTSVHLYGDIVRVLLTEAGLIAGLLTALAGAGLAARAQPATVDMETAFAFLAELAVPGAVR